MKTWLDSLGYSNYDLNVASEDASFRRYFRMTRDDQSWIVMDAPPAQEPCDAFVKVSNKLTGIQLNAPHIIEENHQQGFLILTDFGDVSYLAALHAENADSLYGDAQSALLRMQSYADAGDLPPYDEQLLRAEMELFKHWFVQALLGIEFKPNQLELWQVSVDALVKNALEQPQVFVHRDFHSRNLMHVGENNPGILDFQDAVKGPITYDLVSLLRDCYIEWPEPRVEQWALNFFELAAPERLAEVSASRFMHWFNLMGVQRHLKAIGIFARLNLRDGKAKFLADIPRTLNYLATVSAQESAIAGLHLLIDELALGARIESLIE